MIACQNQGNHILIHSLNINGIKKKIKKVKDFIEINNIDILLLQEVHVCDVNLVQEFFKDHNLHIEINKTINQHNNYNGTAIVINKKIQIKYKMEFSTLEENRVQKLTLSDEENIDLVLYNVYFRTGNGTYVTKQRCKTIELIERDLNKISLSNIFIGGDFNFIMDKLDTNGEFDGKELDIERWSDFEESCNIHDSFRKIDKKSVIFTKVTRSRFARRIDRFYGNQKVLNYSHLPVGFSDHIFSPGILLNQSGCIKWGPGTWKINNTLFNENNLKTVDNMWKNFKLYDNGNGTDCLMSWDKMKQRVKKFYIIKGIQHSKELKVNRSRKEKEIQDMVNNLNPDQLESSERYRQLKVEILEYEKIKYQQFRLHNRLTDIENEKELPEKSFFAKCRENSKTSVLTTIKANDDDGTLLSEPNKIVNAIHQFYTNLWSNKSHISEESQDQYLDNIEVNQPELEDDDGTINPLIVMKELDDGLKSQYKVGKSPGTDGFTYEFYLKHWSIVKDDMLKVLNKSYEQGTLPQSMYESNVKLIPKKGDLTDIKNWRPVSLLNCDYKILSRILYEKIVNFLNLRTNMEQKAIFPGRNIFNIHLNTQSLISYIREKKLEAVILKIDLEKAFDNVNHSFMFKMLNKLHLPPSMIKWIKILYKNPSCQILINGALTPIINILNGIRQGCPLSMLLFGIVLEALIQKIKKNNSINGITFGRSINLKLQACADDVTFYVSDKRSIDAIMQEVRIFGLYSGQRLNERKLEMIAHGPNVCNDLLISSGYREYLKTKINILGIIYSFESDHIEANMIKTLKKAERIIDFNKDRNLSLYGKIQILKTQVIPLFFMKMQCLSLKKYIKRIENMIYKFLWFQYKSELVDRNQLICDFADGGLNMVDFNSRYKAAVIFKLKEIAKATNKSEFWIKYAYYNIGST